MPSMRCLRAPMLLLLLLAAGCTSSRREPVLVRAPLGRVEHRQGAPEATPGRAKSRPTQSAQEREREKRIKMLGLIPVGSNLLKLRAGDRIPANGRVIRTLTAQGKTIPLDAPIALYPSAVVQGVMWIPDPPGSLFFVLLGTDDSPEAVLQYYSTAWRALKPWRPKRPKSSILYHSIRPMIMQQALIVRTVKLDTASVDVQRGPAVQPKDEHGFAQWMLGKAPVPLQPGGKTMTEISLMVPLAGQLNPGGKGPGHRD